MTSRIIAVAGIVPLAVALFAVIDPNSTAGKVGIIALGLGVLVIAVVMHSNPMVPVAPAPVPSSSRRRRGIDLNPPMPKPVADEDMPIERIERRREETKHEFAEIDRVRAEERARVEAERPELTEDRIEQLLSLHYKNVLGSEEGRTLWLKLIREAEAGNVL